jgi:hypothetical protein
MNDEQKRDARNARRRELYAAKKAQEAAQHAAFLAHTAAEAKKACEASKRRYDAMVAAGMPTERLLSGAPKEEMAANAAAWARWEVIAEEWKAANPYSKFY